MTAVNDGDMETAQRLVDEAAERAGYTMPLYHGSKSGGGFTKFRDWSYFTPKEDYARRYTQRGNEEKSLYRTYVKLDNPFDTRDPKARKEFDDIRMEYGLGEIQDTGLPDWTDGYDIADYIGENDLKYDVILLDEGGDLVDGQPVSRGISYVVRKSAQIKSADPVTYDDNGNVIPLSQRFDETNSDIRYFLGDDSDTVPAVDFKARAENIIRLADMLQDGVKNDAEYTALSKVKNNAENIVQKYGELAKLKAELKDVSFAQGPRDTARIESLNAEINSIHRYLNSLESGLASTQAAAPFRDMMQRKIQSSTSKVRREYYDRQKQRTQSRKNTETKNKTLKEIKKLRNRLNNPTKSRNVVNGMQEFASLALVLADAVFCIA